MDEMKGGMGGGMMCRCMHHKAVPTLVILFAVAFLLKAYGVLSSGTVDVVWPVLVGLAGVSKLMNCKCCSGCNGGKCC